MNEAVEVVARFDESGKVIPISFVWGGVKRPILSLGRQWVQDGDRHFLVMTGEAQVYELVYRPAEMVWCLLRTPQDFGCRSTLV
jgi:hypothetical protein